MFRNLKVSTRLALGFGVVSLLLVAVIVLGIRSLASVSENVDEIVKDKHPKVVISYDMIGNIAEIALAMRNGYGAMVSHRIGPKAMSLVTSKPSLPT